MGKFLFGLIFLALFAFTALSLYYRFTTGSFTAAGAEMDTLFGAAKDRIAEEMDEIREKMDERKEVGSEG